MSDGIIVFEDKNIRRVWHNGEWWFVIADIVAVIADSTNPRQYIKNMRNRDEVLSEGWVQIEHPLLVETSGGKQKMSCSNLKGIFRIIQSIPSKKAEPFKRWLAKVGYERVQEIADPELAQKRMKTMYEKKGYSKSWIDKRLRGIAVRQDLTDEWRKRGVKENRDFAILTAEISKAAFGLTPGEYRDLKGLKRENLRDHMTDLELIFSMLGEASTAELERVRDPEDFDEHIEVAAEGGNVASVARKDLERKSGERVVSDENYLSEGEKEVRKGKELRVLRKEE